MKTVLRCAAAIVVGLLVLFAMVVGVEMFSAVVHPFPEGSTQTPEEICAHVERYPSWVLAVVVPMWGAAALASVWIAGRIGNVFTAATIGLLLIAALILNISMLPYPIWFEVASLFVISAAVFVGCRMATRRTTSEVIAND